MPLYNLLEYSQNYSIKSGSLWNYHRDKTDDVDAGASDGKSFKYKTNIIRKTPEKPKNPGEADPPPAPTLNVEVWSHYSTQFLKISWFTMDKLWNRTWFNNMDKRLCIDRTS